MLKVTHDQYIFPPRSKDAIPRADTEIFGMLGWYAQLKYNDSHALIKYCPNGTIELWNRHAERFRTYHAPDWLIDELRIIGTRLGHQPGTITLLDGGLLEQKHIAIKDTIVLWDILVLNDEHLLGTTYDHRFTQLGAAATIEPWVYTHKSHGPIEFGKMFTKNIFQPQNWMPGTWDEAWDIVHKVNAPYTNGEDIKPILEGLVFKDPNGILEMGFKEKNNDAWMMKSRVKTGRHLF